jgi:hypothetical protein
MTSEMWVRRRRIAGFNLEEDARYVGHGSNCRRAKTCTDSSRLPLPQV